MIIATQQVATSSLIQNNKTKLPLVTVIVPCRNEEAFISKCLASIIANDYPKDRLEILVVDGMSEDRTHAFAASCAETHSFVKVVDNPKKFMPFGTNIGIMLARGEIIMVMGAHARYAFDYITKCVAHLESWSADNVGGLMKTEASADTVIAKAIAYVMSHRFGSGTAIFRSGASNPRWVDTVYGGCYRRETFDRIGYFNEKLLKAQDREFNQRLRDAGGKILFTPDIQCSYYARGSLTEFAKKLFDGGFWIFYGNRVGARWLLSPRNFAPLCLVGGLIISLILSSFTSVGWTVFAIMAILYLVGCFACAFPFALRERDLRYLLAVPLVLGTGHLLYGIGSICGIATSACTSDYRLHTARP